MTRPGAKPVPTFAEGPFTRQDREKNRVADVAGPGDPVFAEQALANRADLRQCRLAALVAGVDSKFDPAKPARDPTADHHVLDHSVQPRAAPGGKVIGHTDLQHLATL